MTRWVVIPVRFAGKTRLSSVLDEARRTALVTAMAERAVTAARNARGVDHVYLLGPSDRGIAELALLTDGGDGLNPALQTALAAAVAAGVSRLVVLAGDLPKIETSEIELLAAAPEGRVAIAPDRHGLGTNALSLPLPAAAAFSFAFGTDSCARHYAEAERLGLSAEIIRSDGLACDVDEPADLTDAEHIIAGLALGENR